ncbi:hypothetical protein J2Z49_000516 [Desulfofundulus luciae]|uniref:Uncharacterized protein n=1 Tax=Desulfofundulus luciae TaxID=74702 RepID=A0ABU0AZF0_9FIRM|nr:hypothetical protein [Desulfofundulus luciae]MDQ0285415.1 hypothetical protein [Desulfofundulus luciae]
MTVNGEKNTTARARAMEMFLPLTPVGQGHHIRVTGTGQPGVQDGNAE